MTTTKTARFFFSNFAKGAAWVVAILVIVFGLKKLNIFDYETFLLPLYDKPVLIYLIFFLSEVIVGIIPPEFFMLWALHERTLVQYMTIVLLLATISYAAGLLAYFAGRFLSTSKFFRFFRRRFLKRLERLFYQYGMPLIIVSALTPVPFSGTSMLVGSSRYPLRKYLLYSLSRYFRFIVYAYIIWETALRVSA
ncbi:MAG: VTT domain-containing protein [Bacteroidales bacterium]|nr:VTT domain-containing protein [Bacteroidales bacterium]